MIFLKQTSPIIIGGFYRSGTSLVRRLLDAHSQIDCPPEIKFFKDFYGQYKNDDLAHIRYFATAHSMGLNKDELLDFFGKNFVRLHEIAMKKRGKKRWADKNPENLLYLEQWKKLLNNKMVFIFIVRNTFDILSSLNEIGFKKDMPDKFEKKVDLFKQFTNKGIKFIEKNQNISHIIKYEDLVNSPSEELKKMFKFIDEEYQSSIVEQYNSQERIDGIEDPKIKNTLKIDNKNIGRWKKDLDKYQIDYIKKECKLFLQKFNYIDDDIIL